MRLSRFTDWPSLKALTPAALAGVLLGLTLLLLPACSDDPILGPDEGNRPDDGGGSYSIIDRLAPPDTAADSTKALPIAPPDTNPERF